MSVGLWIATVGAILVLAGLAMHFGLLGWFGRLPGDIRIEGEHGGLYFPITSMLLVSALLTLVSWLLRRGHE